MYIEKYEHIKIVITEFDSEDVITTSNPDDAYESEIVSFYIPTSI